MTRVFISYSHKDETWKDRLQTQFAVLDMEGLLSVWEDRQIELGDSWYPEIEQALNTADVAILLVSAAFLTSKFIRSEEIPRLLKRREQEGVRVIPLIIKPCSWRKVDWLSAMQGGSKDNVELSGLSEYEQESILWKLAEKVHDLLEEAKRKSDTTSSTSGSSIKIDRLPTVKGEFFGREAELKLLNDAWTGDTTNIVQFIAPGGTGKTKILRYWLDQVRPEKLIAWSFYSQGASEEKQPSATPFYNLLFDLLDPSKTITDFANQPEKMGEYLADLLRQQNCLLILDGFEPLQHSSAVLRGELKDRTLRALLKSLAAHHASLCIITTRIAIRELSGYSQPIVISHDLQNLAEHDGINLLKSLHVTGSDTDLLHAVNEYGRHALALHLLGNALTIYLDGDILKRDTLDELFGEEAYTDIERHAFKVMHSYQNWLAGTPELNLLYVLSLLRSPLESKVLQVMWRVKIPGLTDDISEKAWKVAIRDLVNHHHLLSVDQSNPDFVECHPLIKEYFSRRLRDTQPDVWQQARKQLDEFYENWEKNGFLDVIEEIQPLLKETVSYFPPHFPLKWANEWGEDEYGLWIAFTLNGVNQSFRWIPPGTFQMGSPIEEKERFDDETQHQVTLMQGYWLADTACTQALWEAVMGNNPANFKDDNNNPVEQVSWDDVQTFLQKLNELIPGLDLALPTEAQWEYACRAGTATPFSFGENITPEQVNYDGTEPYANGKKGLYREKTVPVKSLPANPWGLYEMHGNVWEWCQDWFGDYPAESVAEPTGVGTGSFRVLRGGAWFYLGRGARSAYRAKRTPDYSDNYFGFRFVSSQANNRA